MRKGLDLGKWRRGRACRGQARAGNQRSGSSWLIRKIEQTSYPGFMSIRVEIRVAEVGQK